MRYRERTRRAVATATNVRFDPGTDTVLAVLTVLAFWPIYYWNSTADSAGAIFLFLVGGNLLLAVLGPAYYVCAVRDEPLSALGITTRGWKRALLFSTLVALLYVPGLLGAAGDADVSTAALIPHVLTIGLMLWEPFFVHGWLQIRFERAFGAIAGIVLASGGFVLFHVGTRSAEGLVVLALVGLFHAIVFRLFDRNLLVLWPIMFAIGSSRGTLGSGLVFGWEEASSYAALLVVSAIGIWLVARE